MRTLTTAAFLPVTLVGALPGQASVNWAAKERGMYQAIVDKNFDAFAAGLDSTFVGVYPTGVVKRDAQVAAVKQEAIQSFQISDFTAQNVDPQSVLLTYKVTISGATSGTYWISSLWHRRGRDWRTVLHTAAPTA